MDIERIVLIVIAGGALLLVLKVIAHLWKPKGSRDSAIYQDVRGARRCRSCDKVVYRDQRAADSVARRFNSVGNYRRVYLENRCGYWHLTSQRPR